MKIAFIGLGNMGGGMAANLVKAGHSVNAFDLSEDALDAAKANGCTPFTDAGEACADVEAVVTRAVQHELLLGVGAQDRAEHEQ